MRDPAPYNQLTGCDTLPHRASWVLLNEGAAIMSAPHTTSPDTQTNSEATTTAYQRFLSAYPAFASTGRLDALRASEYTRLDEQGQVYLDYTGGGVYAEAQVREHVAMLSSGVFGNPHSKNLTSMAMTER